MVTILLVIIGALLLLFSGVLIWDTNKHKGQLDDAGNAVLGLGIGFITDFFDTLGIGSFAPTTMLYKVTRFLRSDEYLPGTLNVGHTIPVCTEAFIFIQAIDVEPVTLFSLIASATIGSVIGARVVSKLPEKKIQLIMGICLIVTAFLMIAKNMGWIDLLGEGNEAIGLHGAKLIIAIVINFILGALMMAGVGLYAPCMSMVYMLGLSPKVAFPVMMGSCAGLMAVGSLEFIRTGKYSRKASWTLTIGGVVGVIIAAKLVKEMPLNVLTWLVVVVVTYTGVSMILQSIKKKAA